MTDDGSGPDRPDESTRIPDPDAPTVTPSGLPTGDAGPHSPTSRPLPDRIGHYRILGPLGEGGMGVVYEAEQQTPRRRVALKVIRGGAFVDDAALRMFQREADTLGRLKHPHIAAIYESGRTDDGQHFFAMELVRGDTLSGYLRSRPEALTPRELRHRLALFRQIADAVHYAHQRGVLHRDLKPGNIIVTEAAASSTRNLSGVHLPAVKVLDFGLARITEGDVKMTMTTEIGVIKGTLPYMSPEQARGESGAIEVRSDVYALGVILYEMLAGRLPYELEGGSVPEALRIICEQAPRSLHEGRTGAKKLDPDVETIVGKALEKEADRRYASAAALAEDVERYLTSKPIEARPPSTMYQLRKFAGRNRVLVSGVLATMLALAIGVVIATYGMFQARAEARRAEAGKLVALAQLELDPDPAESNPSAALAYATASLEAFDTPEGRRMALTALWKGPTALVPQVKQNWAALAFSPDGRWIAHHSGDPRYAANDDPLLLQPADGGPAIPLPGSSKFPRWVQFDPSSRYLLVQGNCSNLGLGSPCPYTATVWSVPDGRILRTWSIEKSAPWAEFRLVGEEVRRVSYADGAFTVESATLEEDGEPIRRRVIVPPDLTAWALNLDGTGAVYITGGGAVPDFDESKSAGVFGNVLEMEEGELRFVSLDGSPSDLFVATWPSGQYTIKKGHLQFAAFDPAGERLATAQLDGTVRIWPISEPGAPVQVLRGRDPPTQMIFDRTGSRLMTVNREGTAQIWDLDGTPGAAPLELHVRDASEMYHAGFDPTGRWAAISDWEHGGPVLFPLDDRLPRVMHGHLGKIWSLAFAPDSRWVTSGSQDGTIRIWPLSSDAGKPRVVLDNGHRWNWLQVSPDGRWIFALAMGGGIWVVPVDGGESRELVARARGWGISPDGRFVATQVDAEIRLWEVETGASELFEMPADKKLTLLQGRCMLSGRRLLMWDSGTPSPGDSWLVLWNLDDGSLRYLWQPNDELGLDDWGWGFPFIASVTLDGRVMLSLVVGEPVGGNARAGRRVLHFGVLDPETGDYRPLPTHPSHAEGMVLGALVDVTGTRLMSVTKDGILRVGPLADQEPHVLLGHDGWITGAEISSDGRWIATAGEDKTVRLWPMPDLAKPPFHTLPHDELMAKLRALTNLRAVPDADALTGYRIDIDPFPGWETVPTW